MTEKDFSKAIKMLREEGILQFKGELLGGTFEVTLLPERPVKPEKEKKPDLDAPPKRRGQDGRSAEEQVALYGAVLDAEE